MFRRRKKQRSTETASVAPDLAPVRDIASVALVHQIARGDLRLGPLPIGPDREAVVREEVLCAMAAGIVIAETWAPELKSTVGSALAALEAEQGGERAELPMARPDTATARRMGQVHQFLLDELRRMADSGPTPSDD
jgi:hypothetical protein